MASENNTFMDIVAKARKEPPPTGWIDFGSFLDRLESAYQHDIKSLKEEIERSNETSSNGIPEAQKDRVKFSFKKTDFKDTKIHMEDDGFKGIPEIDWEGCSVYKIYTDIMTSVNQLREVTAGEFDPYRDKFIIRIAKNQMKYLTEMRGLDTGYSAYDMIRRDWKNAEVVMADENGLIRNVAVVTVLCGGYVFRSIVKRVNNL